MSPAWGFFLLYFSLVPACCSLLNTPLPLFLLFLLASWLLLFQQLILLYRYYEFLDDFRISCGPIFLVIFGEGLCNGISTDYINVLSKKFGAAVVLLEHRYYGKSSPFNSLAAENLRYLSSKQALFDLAIFCQYFQDSFSVKLNRPNVENPWFFFGVSYAGTLSAWFHLRLCHLTSESLASSAVVLVVYNYTEFDQHTTELFEQNLATDGKAVKALFGAAKLEINGDFFYFLAYAAAIRFQYGNQGKVCSSLVEAKKNGDDLVRNKICFFAGVICQICQRVLPLKFRVSVGTYNQEHLKNTTLTGVNSHRLWWFQVCTEVAYFQVAPSNDNIRSSKVDTSVWFDTLYESLVVALYGKYHLDLCKNVFGEGIYPNVTATNIYYGGKNIVGRKIIFTNGSQDPWPQALKQISSPDCESSRDISISRSHPPYRAPHFFISCGISSVWRREKEGGKEEKEKEKKKRKNGENISV
ncbi:hypothetical protein UlMin_029927 [Ulmus minor]